jgi:hypothetical protein
MRFRNTDPDLIYHPDADLDFEFYLMRIRNRIQILASK